MVRRAVLTLLVSAALMAVGSVSVGETPKEAPIATGPGVGEPLQSPGLPTLYDGGGGRNREPQGVESPSAPFPLREHDPLYAYVYDPGFELPRPAPAPQAQVMAATLPDMLEHEVLAVLIEAGWPEPLHDAALRLSFCESGYYHPVTKIKYWRPWAIGDGGASVGLFQMQWSGSSWRGWFIPAGEDEAQRLDPVVNARTALWAYNRSGWEPWTCKKVLP